MRVFVRSIKLSRFGVLDLGGLLEVIGEMGRFLTL